ncbi:MAG TPA: ABC transporter ATP-binding protein [Microthrixaceae bacterium]|nr:ABC transporter ATP-binding protein [Microthrixaceae bacterium]
MAVPSPSPADAFLHIDDLQVGFDTEDGLVQAVRGVDLSIDRGEVVAVVGESGSGKSVTFLAVLGLHPEHHTQLSGRISWQGEDLVTADEDRLRSVRGAEISMIFQDPLTALNPVHTVGKQITETIRAHENTSKQDAKARAVDLLGLVGIPQPQRRVDMYPHEFSGGMRQRAMIAMALSCEPELVIADEPTTALDVTVQAQVLELLLSKTREVGAGLVLITHDLGVVAGMADRVAVMYAGRIAERGEIHEVFEGPRHPYTIGLLDSLPRVDAEGEERLRPIGGQPPSMLHPPPGCAFHPRCRIASEDYGCMRAIPEVVPHGHSAACWRQDEVDVLLGSRATRDAASDADAEAREQQ